MPNSTTRIEVTTNTIARLTEAQLEGSLWAFQALEAAVRAVCVPLDVCDASWLNLSLVPRGHSGEGLEAIPLSLSCLRWLQEAEEGDLWPRALRCELDIPAEFLRGAVGREIARAA